ALPKPEMVEPVAKKPEPKAAAKPEPTKEEPQLHGRTPTQGAEVKAGTARVDTKQTTAIRFGGLATGGGGGSGAYTDFADFCCPEYIQVMRQHIYANWRDHLGQDGGNKMRFVVLRDDTTTDNGQEGRAGQSPARQAPGAVMKPKPPPPLPMAFKMDRLTVHLEFEYKR